ncbi:hypothetical protein OQA88_11808 [Cercophora sp. LCS_1]
MPSTCGSFALKQGKPKANSKLFETVVAAGLIVIGKSNLSELGNAKGSNIMAGWSAVGGQTQSPYVRGGVTANATWLSRSGPAGSSSGSAVGVAAGFAPMSMGTESDGSIIMPAARAGVYALKLTPGSADTRGLQPGPPGFDCVGPFAKTTTDVAIFSAIMQQQDPESVKLPEEEHRVRQIPECPNHLLCERGSKTTLMASSSYNPLLTALQTFCQQRKNPRLFIINKHTNVHMTHKTPMELLPQTPCIPQQSAKLVDKPFFWWPLAYHVLKDDGNWAKKLPNLGVWLLKHRNGVPQPVSVSVMQNAKPA